MTTKYWGPRPWVNSRRMTRRHMRLEGGENRYSDSAPIFNELQTPANFTPDRRQARIAQFGEWNLERFLDGQRGFQPNHLEAQLYRLGVQSEARRFETYDRSNPANQMVDGVFLQEVATDLNEECIAEDLPASLAFFHHQSVITDSRREQRDLFLLTDLFTTGAWLGIFSQRFWVFFMGNYQPGSTPYPEPLPVLPTNVHISVPNAAGAFVPGPAVLHNLVLSPAGFEALNVHLAAIMHNAADPADLVVHTWWSLEPNPVMRNAYPLHGPVWGYPAYDRMFRRYFAHYNDYVAAGNLESGIRGNLYFGRFPANLLPRNVLGQKVEHLPTLEPPIPFTAPHNNYHWWMIIIDSYTAQTYRHESVATGGVSGPVTTRFLHNLNRIFRRLPPPMLENLMEMRALKPHTDKADVLAWETIQRQTKPNFRAHHIQSFRTVTTVGTMVQSGGVDCGIFVIRYMREFVRGLAEGIIGGEKRDLNPPPFDVAAQRATMHTSLAIPRVMPPVDEDNEPIDSIGQQLARHPEHLERAMWHIENAGAILICYTNTERRVRNTPVKDAEVFQLPECIRTVGSDGSATCDCGFIVLPVPPNHKVILHSTQQQDLTDATQWEETELGMINVVQIEQARLDTVAKSTFKEGTPEYATEMMNSTLRRKALGTHVLRPVPVLPRLLVGRNVRGPRLGCRGAFVMSNHTATMAPEDNRIKACGYRMENPNGINILGPLVPGAAYPMSVNESLWAWVSQRDARTVVAQAKSVPAFKQRTRTRTRKRLDTLGGLVIPREAHQYAAPVDYHQIPVIAANRGLFEDARITTTATQTESLARTVRREAQESPYPYYVPYDDDYDSFDDTLPLTCGLLPRKVRRTRNTERNNRKLYEYSDSEYDTAGAFDPTGESRTRKRLRQSTLPANALTYMSIDPKQPTQSLPVTPCREALDWYKNVHQTKIRITDLPAEQRMPQGRMQIRVLIKHTNGIAGEVLKFRTRELPRSVLLGGYQSIVRYLKASPHDLTEPGGEPNVAPQMGETDELEYMTPNGISPLESEADFAAFCQSLDAAWDADNGAVSMIEVSKWPTYCMTWVNFTFTHGGADHAIPQNMLTTLGGVECGINAYISRHIDSRTDSRNEFTLVYRQLTAPGVYGEPQTFWGIYEPIVNGTTVVDENHPMTVNITLNLRAPTTIHLYNFILYPDGLTEFARMAVGVFDLYLNTHFPQLDKFKEYCTSATDILRYENPQLFYDSGVVAGASTWVHLNTQAAWLRFLGGVVDGAVFHMSFRRPIFCPTRQFITPLINIFQGTVHFRFGQRSVTGNVLMPVGEYIYISDIHRVNQAAIAAALIQHTGTLPPFSHVICDGTLPIPHDNTFSYAQTTMDTIVAQLIASLRAREFEYTAIVIYGWVAGSPAEAALRAVADAARAARDVQRAAFDLAHPGNPPRDYRWVRIQQQLVAEHNLRNPPAVP